MTKKQPDQPAKAPWREYWVTLPLTGSVSIAVEARDADTAITEALTRVNGEHLRMRFVDERGKESTEVDANEWAVHRYLQRGQTIEACCTQARAEPGPEVES